MFKYVRTPHSVVLVWKLEIIEVTDVFLPNLRRRTSNASVIARTKITRVDSLSGVDQYTTVLEGSRPDVQDRLKFTREQFLKYSLPSHRFRCEAPVRAGSFPFDGSQTKIASVRRGRVHHAFVRLDGGHGALGLHRSRARASVATRSFALRFATDDRARARSNPSTKSFRRRAQHPKK
jgi:hypothetical protein